MHSTETQQATNMETPQEYGLKKFVDKLYRLKEKFENKYYRISGYDKYEMARSFNIDLAATLFEVNRLRHLQGTHFQGPSNNRERIKKQIDQLEEQLGILIS
ncbi:hypothetical protein [Pseudozobellia thermophila]|uniref:Uncharacterized protein n=1 Tax=Pseudozobellia thermophila TaxID=192903 RepID=A0A1M6KN75_9FLAO|nr:hypothetical protein [Pseudozobellia thermophila]SHJ60362.1 hypothetical protein SAMN04488513_106129 [Pseudozobellia thermophila]